MRDDVFDIEPGFKSIRYREGDRVLEFDREPGGANPTALVWFPSPKQWRETMPPWALERRREILSRLRAVARNDEWRVSYAEVDAVRDDDLDWVPPQGAHVVRPSEEF